MKNDKIHLIPQAVIEVAQGIANTKQDNLRMNYVMRLEAIKEYCDEILKTTNNSTRQVFTPVKKKSILR